MPLAPDQVLVAGVIDTVTNFIEHPEVVADRLERVAEAVGDPRACLPAPIAASTPRPAWGRVAEDIVWAKLAAMVEGARLASRAAVCARGVTGRFAAAQRYGLAADRATRVASDQNPS